MKQLRSTFRRLALKLAMLALLALPAIASAQYFTDTGYGDMNAGFRKTGGHQESGEIVAYLGNVTNFLTLPAGSQITISNFNTVVLSNMCPDGFNFLQWSVFASFTGPDSWTTPLGVFPGGTSWYTVARTNVNVQTMPVNRFTPSAAPSLTSQMLSVPDGAYTIASGDLITTNVNNNALVVLEPISDGPQFILDAYIGNNGDFGGHVLSFSVENNTSNSFTSPVVSDFYQNVPTSTRNSMNIDPITGLSNGPAYYVGYFTLYPSGTLTFNRAAATPPPPVAGFSGTPTTGFAPLQVTFTDSSTGTITNWVWNFGDGQSVTNTSNASVNHTYSAAGTYSVSLTVNGPGGSNASTQSGYVVASPTPTIGNVIRSGGSLVFSGTNCPAGVQYRILTSTNVALPVASWQPVATNNFLSNGTFFYTNSTSSSAAFFRLVSP
jgi:PKD repeat protein